MSHRFYIVEFFPILWTFSSLGSSGHTHVCDCGFYTKEGLCEEEAGTFNLALARVRVDDVVCKMRMFSTVVLRRAAGTDLATLQPFLCERYVMGYTDVVLFMAGLGLTALHLTYVSSLLFFALRARTSFIYVLSRFHSCALTSLFYHTHVYNTLASRFH